MHFQHPITGASMSQPCSEPRAKGALPSPVPGPFPLSQTHNSSMSPACHAQPPGLQCPIPRGILISPGYPEEAGLAPCPSACSPELGVSAQAGTSSWCVSCKSTGDGLQQSGAHNLCLHGLLSFQVPKVME